MRTPLALLLAFLVLAPASCSDDAPSTPTPTPSATSEVSATPEVTSTVPPTPTATSTFVTPPPVTNRLDEPRVAPGTDYPTVGLDETGIALAAEGTLVVYAKELSREPDLEVVVFDLAKREQLSSFPLVANRNFSVQLGGNRVLASFGRQLWSYALDGSDGLLLDDELPGVQMLPSPDGRYVAIAGWGEDLFASVAIIEVATGDHIVEIDVADALPDWTGEPVPERWLADGQLLVGALCHCDGSPPGLFDAIVAIDGSVARAPADLPPRRPVSVEVADGFLPGCALAGYSGSRSIRIVDASTGEVLAEATDDAPVLLGGELSPDNTEALINVLAADENLRPKLNAALARGDCYEGPETSFEYGSWTLGLLRTGGTSLEPVGSRLEVFEHWYDERLSTFTCGDEIRAGVVTLGWFDHASWRDPAGFASPWGFTSADCDGRTLSIDMTIAGVEIDTDATGYRVLGFLRAE